MLYPRKLKLTLTLRRPAPNKPEVINNLELESDFTIDDYDYSHYDMLIKERK